MPAWTMVNGVWRNIGSSTPLVDNVTRDSDIYANVDGLSRLVYKHFLTADDILGFRMVYKLSYTKTHKSFQDLKFNPNIPVSAHVTGKTNNRIDTISKGILLEYTNEQTTEEGIYMYQGSLYAILTNDQLVEVTKCKEHPGSTEIFESNIPDHLAIITNRLVNIPIEIEAKLTYNSYGYYMAGWNSFFSTDQYLDYSNYPFKGPHKDTLEISTRTIYPVTNRIKNFNPVCEIGIARDMSSKINNMIGSYGILDQTIYHINADGKSKPFSVEIYN